MKATTLTEYVDKKVKSDPEFAKHYAREQAIVRIAEMIATARKKAKITQEELANKIGTTQSVIARLESGHSTHVPSLDTIIKIAIALKVELKISMNIHAPKKVKSRIQEEIHERRKRA